MAETAKLMSPEKKVLLPDIQVPASTPMGWGSLPSQASQQSPGPPPHWPTLASVQAPEPKAQVPFFEKTSTRQILEIVVESALKLLPRSLLHRPQQQVPEDTGRFKRFFSGNLHGFRRPV